MASKLAVMSPGSEEVERVLSAAQTLSQRHGGAFTMAQLARSAGMSLASSRAPLSSCEAEAMSRSYTPTTSATVPPLTPGTTSAAPIRAPRVASAARARGREVTPAG